MSAKDKLLEFFTFGAYVPDREMDPNAQTYGTPAGGSSPPTQPLDMTAANQQQQALERMVDRSRAGVTGAYDKAIEAQNKRREDALKVLMGNIGSVGAATAASSGVQGLLGSGAAQASGRQTALQAAQAANQMMGQQAVDIGNILQRRAQAELGFAQQDVRASAANMQAIANDIENLKKTSGLTAQAYQDQLMARAQRYPVGSPEYNMYMNEATIVGQSGNILIA